MPNETTPPVAEQSGPNFVIQRVYLKDASVEAPNTPGVFLEEWKPQMDIEIQNRSQEIAPETHEVILRISVNVKIKEKVAFLIEVQQAGIFTIPKATHEQLGPIIGSYCPSILFPYAREAIANLTLHAGFPPVHLAPINFDAAYHQHMQQLNAEQGSPIVEETQH